MTAMINPDELRLSILQNAELKRDFRMKMAECYDKIIALAKCYLDMPEDYYHVIATWIIGTYFHELFPAYPYLFFNAMRGSGKTRLLKFVSALGAKGDGSVQNNLTEAVVFRIPRGTTTCIDEVEQIGSKDKQTLRELLNSAYKKGMKVKRMRKVKTQDGEKQVAEVFEPYFPICLANIWGMDEILGDRSISLILEKSNNPFITKMFEDFDNEDFQQIKRTLEKFSDVSDMTLRKKNIYKEWNNYLLDKNISSLSSSSSLTSLTTLTTLKPEEQLQRIEMEQIFIKIDNLGINGRNFELLMPLLLVNEMISYEHFERFLKIGNDIMTTKKEEEYLDSKDVSLYEFIGNRLIEDGEYHSIKEITSEFRLFCGDGDQDDRWLNERWMGRALKRLCLIIQSRKISTGRQVILNYKKAREKLKIFKEDAA